MKIWVPVISFKQIHLGGKQRAVTYEVTLEHHQAPKKRWVRVLVSLGLIILLAGGIIALLIHTLSSPAEGTIDNSGTPAASAAAQNTLGNYKDAYISFSYPGNFTQVSSQKPAGYLSAVNLLSSDHPSVYVAIGLVSESLGNDSGLNYRQLHPDLYKTVTDNSSTKVFSRSQGGAEYTGFIANNGMVLSVSLTSVSPTKLPSDYNFIAKSLSWQQ